MIRTLWLKGFTVKKSELIVGEMKLQGCTN